MFILKTGSILKNFPKPFEKIGAEPQMAIGGGLSTGLKDRVLHIICGL